ncbi:MAG: 16S rRNA (adenine(1518)-N(6)/adenine(1519)-N(6))-dimethyltransferase RsmA [Candidatus Nezhaarchaeota archaeon]|nr:16S rRNA (adenine(1518)-N(6)/adenine(1519)-N(6))-dimethyltransferase RsmA [Candidatus Nezhaarchaeota archaeon]
MMVGLRERTITLIRRYSIRPNKRLGQTFLIDEDVAKSIVDASEVDGLNVLEVGAGLGALTEMIASRAKLVYAVEVDPLLVRALREEVLKGRDNVVLVEADFLDFTPPPVEVVVSNIPYKVATPILFRLARRCVFDRAVLTIQRELALRLTSKPGVKDYGRLTASLDVFFEPKLVGIVNRRCFYPRPDVDSAIVKLKRRKPPYEVVDVDFHLEMLRMLFSQRNRLLKKALSTSLEKLLKVKADRGLYADPRLAKYVNVRVKDLQPSELADISNVVREFVKQAGGAL